MIRKELEVHMNHTFLTFIMNESWAYLHRLLSGLSDHEFFWEPAPNCWRIYQAANGRWTYDYQLPHPQPSPLTTIGWRLIHIASCKIMYYEYAFGPGRLTFPELTIPHTATDAVDRKSTRLNSSHANISYAVFCLKKKKKKNHK